MRKKDIQGLAHDLENLRGWENPIDHFKIPHGIILDLLKEDLGYEYNDSIKEFYLKKRVWFIERVAKLNGKISDFEYVKIFVENPSESVEISYKGEVYTVQKYP